MIPRNLDELRRQMVCSQRSDLAVQDHCTQGTRECNSMNASYVEGPSNQSHWLHKQRWNQPSGSQIAYDPDSVPSESSGIQTQHGNNYRLLSWEQDKHFAVDGVVQHCANKDLNCTLDRPIYQDRPCSHPQQEHSIGFVNVHSSRQGNSQTHYSQAHALLAQPESQAFHRNSLPVVERRTHPYGMNKPDYFEGCVPCSFGTSKLTQQGPFQQTNQTWFMPPAGQEGAAPSKTAPHDDLSESIRDHGSQCGKMASMPMRGGANASGLHQTFSQSCSTQAETLSSTQRAGACEPPKGKKPTTLQPYMRLDGVAKHGDYRYHKYIDSRPGIKANYWLKCAYCTSNKVYRKQETLRKHMESNICGWMPEPHKQSQILPTSSTNTCKEPHQQRERPISTPSSNAARKKDVTIPSDSFLVPQPPFFDERQTNPNVDGEMHGAVPPPRQLVAFQASSASRVNSLTQPPYNGPEGNVDITETQGTAFSRLGFHSTVTQQLPCGLAEAPSTAFQKQQSSPESSGVSTCLEELPLEQLLGRLSDSDIQLLLQTTIRSSASSNRIAPTPNPASVGFPEEAHALNVRLGASLPFSVNGAVMGHHAEREANFGCSARKTIGHVPQSSMVGLTSQSLAASGIPLEGGKQLEQQDPPPLVSVGVESILGNRVAGGSLGQKPRAIEKQKVSTKPRPAKPQPTHRTCGIQTQLRMKYLDKVLLFYTSRNKTHKKKRPQEIIKSEGAVNTNTRCISRGRPKKKNVEVLKPTLVPVKKAVTTQPNSNGRDAQKSEAKISHKKDVMPSKRSQRLSCLYRDKKEESEVLRQQSTDFPLLLVGADLLIKEKQSEGWEACTIGNYNPSTGRHDVTLASRHMRLRLCEHELLTKL